MPKSVKGARIACLDMNLQKARMLFGVQASQGDALFGCLPPLGHFPTCRHSFVSHCSAHHCLYRPHTCPFVPQVLVTDPKELEQIRQRELDITRERIQRIIDAGA